MHPPCILVDEDATDEDETDATDEDAMDEDATDEVHHPPAHHPRMRITPGCASPPDARHPPIDRETFAGGLP